MLMAAVLFLANCGQRKQELESERISDSAYEKNSDEPSLAKDINLNTKTPADKKLIKTAELKFKVANVLKATEKIEDMTAKYEGYITYSNLQNREDNYDKIQYKRDSTMVCRLITVVNQIQLRVPNVNLDSFVRNLNPLVLFLDNRIIKMSDVTYQYIANQNKSERLKKYGQRQEDHITNKESKLKETTSAEENLLDKQLQSDEAKLSNLELEDQLKYCDISMEIYQKPILVKEVVFDFSSISDSKPNVFKRIIDSIVDGWLILEEIIVFLFKLWWLLLIALSVYLIVKYIDKKFKK